MDRAGVPENSSKIKTSMLSAMDELSETKKCQDEEDMVYPKALDACHQNCNHCVKPLSRITCTVR